MLRFLHRESMLSCDWGQDNMVPFCRWYFLMHFLEWKPLHLIQIKLKFVPKGLIDNKSSCGQIMACCLYGAKPLSEPMMTQFNYAYTYLSMLPWIFPGAPSNGVPGNIQGNLPALHICVTLSQWVNSLSPGRFKVNFRWVIFKLILVVNGWGISCETALIWVSLDHPYDKSTLVQVMAWCRQATSHYLSQCWPRSLSPYGVTLPQWINDLTLWNLMIIKVASFKIFVNIGSGNSLSPPLQWQAITLTSVNILSIGHLGTNFSGILIKMQMLLLKKICIWKCCLEMSAILLRPQCVECFNVLVDVMFQCSGECFVNSLLMFMWQLSKINILQILGESLLLWSCFGKILWCVFKQA